MWSIITYEMKRICPVLLGLSIGAEFLFWWQGFEPDRLNACIPDCAPYSVVKCNEKVAVCAVEVNRK